MNDTATRDSSLTTAVGIRGVKISRSFVALPIATLITCIHCSGASIPDWKFTDEGFVDGGQNGAKRTYTNPTTQTASPWSLQTSDKLTLRLTFEDDNSCYSHNQYNQIGVATNKFTFSKPTRIYINYSGLGEQRNYGYERISAYINGVQRGGAHSPGGDLSCDPMAPLVDAPALTTYADVPAGNSAVRVVSETGDPLFHHGAHCQVAFSFATYGELNKMVVAGGAHALAVKLDGTVRAWGWNAHGQLGDNSQTTRLSPVQVSGLSGVKAVAAGAGHSVALKNDGTVWTWGLNWKGALGNNTTNNSSVPIQVSGLNNIVQVAAGGYHTLALDNNGNIYAWGWNSSGQLGTGNTTDSKTPVLVSTSSGIYGITEIHAGFYHSAALNYNGVPWTWGENGDSQLGDGYTTDSSVPVDVSSMFNGSSLVKISTGGSHNIAIDDQGVVWTWGLNSYGQLGLGNTSPTSVPNQITGLTGITNVSAGYMHTLAAKTGGDTYSWGLNSDGQLGDGTTTSRSSPSITPYAIGTTGLYAGGYYSMVLFFGETSLQTFGQGSLGQIGDGNGTQSLTPAIVSGFDF